jgi:hypothetical protein
MFEPDALMTDCIRIDVVAGVQPAANHAARPRGRQSVWVMSVAGLLAVANSITKGNDLWGKSYANSGNFEIYLWFRL